MSVLHKLSLQSRSSVLRSHPAPPTHRTSAVVASSVDASPASSACSVDSQRSSIFAGVSRRAVERVRSERNRRTTRNPLSRRMVVAASAAAVAPSQGNVLKTVEVELGDRSYPIYIGNGLLANKPELLRKHVPSKKVLIVTNETIAPLYLEQ